MVISVDEGSWSVSIVSGSSMNSLNNWSGVDNWSGFVNDCVESVKIHQKKVNLS